MGHFKTLLEQEEYLILHGALGTELEFLGHDVSGKLWSAKYLLEDPDLIQSIHETYLRSGSDIVTTSSYQASLQGLCDYGLSQEEAEKTIALTVDLAKKAREKVWQGLSEKEKHGRPYPLISGDVGPYAAYLADGSEYTGDYGSMDKEGLKDFHRPRIAVLLEKGSDLLALETIPSFLEAKALTELLQEEFPAAEAYMSFTAQNSSSISDGTAIEEVAALLDAAPQILALGINCSSPLVYTDLLKKMSTVTDKPLVTYPNSGEVYDGQHQTWTQTADRSHTLLENTVSWQNLGAKIVGGCCRTRPSDIESLSQGLKKRR